MERRPSNFSVVSKGYCFLCLDKIFPDIDNISSSITSFQDISRYLKLDMRKVFIQGGPIPYHLLAKVEKSNLKVELCCRCSKLTHDISKRCKELEKLKIEIEAGLESIHAKMLEADLSGRTEQFRKATGSELNSGMGGWKDVLDVLRLETKQKCSSKIKMSSPRLKVQKLSTKEIIKRTIRIPKKEVDITSEQMSESGVTHDSIKIAKEPDNANWTPGNGNEQSENSFAEDWHHQVEESDSDTAQVKHAEITDDHILGLSGTNNKEIERKWAINPDTGKYKCRLCTMEFASFGGGFHNHYNTVHRKVRFKCNICGKEFTQKCSYKRHHECVHLGVRFECKVCQKKFTQKCDFRAHQRKGCEVDRKTKS